MSEPAAAAKDWSDVVKGAKRELLLRAARDEFAEQGLEGATMRGIAVRAGCTTGAIYPLFDSKEAIYAELLKQSLAALDTHVAEAVKHLDLKHAVITSVNRDDLADGGSRHWAETIRRVRKMNPECRVEVLIAMEGTGAHRPAAD